MIIRVDGADAVILEGADDFTRFHVEVRGLSDPAQVNAALATASVGRAEDRDHAFISLGGLKKLAGAHVNEAWLTSLDKMLAYARKKGWWDEATQSIAAHLEWK